MIRTAKDGDADAIAKIWNAEIRKGFATFTTEEKTLPDLKERIISEPPFLVADINGAVAGFACAGRFRAGPGYAHCSEITIYLARDMQGQGLGRRLMQGLEDRLRDQGKHIMIAAISGSNTQALAFHQAVGFQSGGILPQAGRKHENWLDLHLLFKHL